MKKVLRAAFVALLICVLAGYIRRDEHRIVVPRSGLDAAASAQHATSAHRSNGPGLTPRAHRAAHSSGYVPQQLLVMFRDGVAASRIDEIVAAGGARVIKAFTGNAGLRLLALPNGVPVLRARKLFGEQPEVAIAEPDYLYYTTVQPDDPSFDLLWGLHNRGQTGGIADVDIGAPEAWDRTTGSEQVYVGVIDTGVDYEHPDLVANVWVNPGETPGNDLDDDGNGWVDDIHGTNAARDFTNPARADSDPFDDSGHGTHVSGTIAARGNNGVGVVGVAWQAKIISCKGLDGGGTGALSSLIECLEYFSALKESGIDVVATNNSWGGGPYSQLLYNAIERHQQQNILFVAAAGNAGVDIDVLPDYPASFDLDIVLSVAAIDDAGALAPFSNYGANGVDIAAPGVDVYGTLPYESFGYESGTSMAAPYVTGVAALLKANDPEITAAQIKQRILATGAAAPNLQGYVLSGRRLVADLPILDRDGDDMDDGWEAAVGLDPSDPTDGALDGDGDGLTNVREFLAGSNPFASDTDGDGLGDGAEVDVHATDPARADTDADGLTDSAEINVHGTNPNAADSDGDGLEDGAEIDDTGTDPLNADGDADGIADGWEVQHGLDPNDGTDGGHDDDGDGLSNMEEFAHGSDPARADSDGDGLGDADEVRVYGSDPATNDSDGDLMADGWEVAFGLDPLNDDAAEDPDDDGYSNRSEFRVGTDPHDEASVPEVTRWSSAGGGPAHRGHVQIETRTSDFSIRWIHGFESGGYEDIVAASDRQAFFSQDSGYLIGRVSSLDMADGHVTWSRDFADTAPFSLSPPVLYGDSVAVLTEVSQGSLPLPLYALDADDGAQRYSRSIDLEFSPHFFTGHADRFFLGNGEALISLDAATGNPVWQRAEVARLGGHMLAVDDTRVVDHYDNVLVVYDRATGDTLFENTESTCNNGDPDFVILGKDDTAYVHMMFCVIKYDLSSRRMVWEKGIPMIVEGMTVDDDTVYVGSWDGVQALNAVDGSERWRWKAPEQVAGNLVSTLSHVFVSTETATYALDRATGAVSWTSELHGRLAISPDSALIIATSGSFSRGAIAVIDMTGDRDDDGLPDWWERYYGFDLRDPADGARDADADGLANVQEVVARSDPRAPDTDEDGLSDGEEVETRATDPLRADTDYDGLTDDAEVHAHGTDPAHYDSDKDGYTDRQEIETYATDPNNPADAPALPRSYPGRDARNVLAVSDNLLHEFTPTRERMGDALPIPQAVGANDLVVLPDHRIAILDAAELHIYDPPSGTFYRTSVSGWHAAAGIVATGEYILAADAGAAAGILRFDLNGTFIDRLYPGRAYVDLARSDDGTVHALRPESGIIDRFDAGTWSMIGTTELEVPSGIAFAVGPDGDYYVSDRWCPLCYMLVRYDGEGRVVTAAEPAELADYEGSDFFDVDFLASGQLVVGLRDGAIVYADSALTTFSHIQLWDELSESSSFVARVEKSGVDTDGDGAPNWWEHAHGFSSANAADAGDDADGDGLTNRREYEVDSDPRVEDTDGDGLNDRTEVNTQHTSPVVPDTDGDGLTDGDEVERETDPLERDTDGDGLEDGHEVSIHGTNPLRADTDRDGLDDGWEIDNGLDPLTSADAQVDADGDGLSNGEEEQLGTELHRADTDYDDLSDAEEVEATMTDPLNDDSDGDGMWDGWEVHFGMDPRSNADASSDADGDGFDNKTEFFADSNPVAVSSFPVIDRWYSHQGDASHTGFVPVRLEPSEFTAYWLKDVLPSNSTDLRQVASADGRVYVSNKGYFRTPVLAALDGLTGVTEWELVLDSVSGANSPPALSDGKVYVQTSSPGTLWALDAESGAIRLQSEFDEQFSDYLAPTPYGGDIYAQSGTYSGIGAFDGTTGAEKWNAYLPQYQGWTPAVDADSVYVHMGYDIFAAGDIPARLDVLYRDSGLRRFTIDDPNFFVSTLEINSGPALGHEQNVIAVQGGRVVKFDLRHRSVAWEVPGGYAGSAALANGVIYAVDNGELVALRERDGQELWRWIGPSFVDQDPLATIDHVFAATRTDTFAVDLNTGLEVWRFPRGGALSLGNDGVLYIAGSDGALQAIATFADLDRDGMADAWERQHGFDAGASGDAARDADGDGLSNLAEFRAQTQPRERDTDADDLTDGDEVTVQHTDPHNPDTDADGLTDAAEVQTHHTDPTARDTDSDGLSDAEETDLYGTSPTKPDTDADGIADGTELELSSDPSSSASKPTPVGVSAESFELGQLPARWKNGVGATVGWEVVAEAGSDGDSHLRSMPLAHHHTAAVEWTDYFFECELLFDLRGADYDSEGFVFYVDGVPRFTTYMSTQWATLRTPLSTGAHTLRWEFTFQSLGKYEDPSARLDFVRIVTPDADGDALPDEWELLYGLDPLDADDATLDTDSDGLTNLEEYNHGTRPDSADTDSDGMPDGWEINFGLSPTSSGDAGMDSDGDGYTNLDEFRAGTDPRDPSSNPSSPPPPPGPGASGGGGGAADPLAILLFAILVALRSTGRARWRGVPWVANS